ncbi:MAG: phospholipid carrier-dependent glycosyltransferase [Defluviitaleaceae bacterium]|nr:phospholipid carrier-dependent glycosyltransferase [Defluviitaleaceae bacterium]
MYKNIAPLLILIGIYSIIAFYNLGNTQSPQTAWTGTDTVMIDLGRVQYISRFQFMNGARNDIPFLLQAAIDEWDFSLQIDQAGVFTWNERYMKTYARFISITPLEANLRLQEVAFRDRNDRLIYPISLMSPGAEALFDEQHLVPLRGSIMNSIYFDEIYHARAGYEYLHGLAVLENTHPPMGKNFIALSIRTFGMTPFAWRFPGTLAGILMIPLMYIFGRMVFRSAFWGMVTSFIFTFDFMPFVQTRIATIDSYVTLFIIAAYLCMYAYIRDCDTLPLKKALLWLAGSGFFMGLAIASKWQGLYAAIGLAVIFFPSLYRVYKRNENEARITFFYCFAFFVAIPAIIYLLSYIPFARTIDGGFFAIVIANQENMFSYHSLLTDGHPFSSRWWEWPLLIRPIFYYANTVSDEIRQGISSFGNPAIWWVGIFATVAAITALKNKSLSEHHQTLRFLLIAYAAQFVPWVFVFRATFIYHYFPSVPFVVLLIVFCLKTYIAPKYPRLVWGYGALVLGLFILFYPVLSGTPVSAEFVHTFLRWLPAWILTT